MQRDIIFSPAQTELLRAYEAAKAVRNFAESDRIRDELLKEGIALEDGPQGTTWRYVGK